MSTYQSNENLACSKALELRGRLGLGLAPITDMAVLFESLGFDLAVIETKDENAHGMTAKDSSSGRVFTVVSATQHPMRQRSNIAHELGHIIFGEWHESGKADYAVRDGAEIRADAFARHLLIPEQSVKQFAEHLQVEELNLADFSKLVQTYQVSPAMAAIAASNAGVITVEAKDEFKQYSTFKLVQQFGWADQYRALQFSSAQKKAPQRLMRRAVSAYQQGVVGLQAVATLRQVPLAQIEAEFVEAGIVPLPLDDNEFADFDTLAPVSAEELDSIFGGDDV